MVPATTFAEAPIRIASKSATDSVERTSPTISAESPNSKVSSIVKTLYFLIISKSKEDKKEVFPELLVPAIKCARAPSIVKLRRPAPKGEIIPFFMNKGKVQGVSLCRRKDIP